MRVLIACEFSGRVRDAFIAKGHDAMSCDLLPSELPGPHYQGDIRDVLSEGWDLMVAHPPCTYLSYAANRYWNKPGRKELRQDAFDFFMTMITAPINKVCVENPIGYPNTVFRKPDQIIQPYYFGDAAVKTTCLWLKNLPKLYYQKQDGLFLKATATDYPKPVYFRKTDGKAIHWTESNHGGKNRSRTFQGIANAMAEQWGAQ